MKTPVFRSEKGNFCAYQVSGSVLGLHVLAASHSVDKQTHESDGEDEDEGQRDDEQTEVALGRWDVPRQRHRAVLVDVERCENLAHRDVDGDVHLLVNQLRQHVPVLLVYEHRHDVVHCNEQSAES